MPALNQAAELVDNLGEEIGADLLCLPLGLAPFADVANEGVEAHLAICPERCQRKLYRELVSVRVKRVDIESPF